MRGHTVAFGFITAALGLSVLIHWAVLKNTRIYFSEKQGSRLPELVFWGSILNRNQLIDARPEHSASTTAPAWFDVETPPPENHVLSRKPAKPKTQRFQNRGKTFEKTTFSLENLSSNPSRDITGTEKRRSGYVPLKYYLP